MLTKVYGSAVFGIDATTITVEVNVASGIGYHLVGLPDNAIKEKKLVKGTKKKVVSKKKVEVAKVETDDEEGS